MHVNDSRIIFSLMLGNLKQSTDYSKKIFQELGQAVSEADIRDAMQSGLLLADCILKKINQCCEILNQKPLKVYERLDEAFIEDFRRELAQVHFPEAKTVFVLAKASQLIQLHMGIEIALIAAADFAGHYRLGILLDDCLEEKMAFAERIRRLLCERLQQKRAA